MIQKRALLFITLLSLLFALTLSAPVHPILAQDNDGAVPRFEYSDCPVEVPAFVEVTCGYLVVPESRADPDSPTIRIAVAILKSRSSSPERDPVVYLEGGPGGSALDGIDFWMSNFFLESRDLILVDQRGTGKSEPGLHCPEWDEANEEYYETSFDEEEELEFVEDLTYACRDRLIDEGVNLAAYNSAESAADFADLREVLGYEEWNLYGISYGTRLALTIMRDHPEGIRSVILDSTVAVPINAYEESPDYTARAFGVFFQTCADDPICGTAYPTLESDFYETVEAWNESPATLRFKNPYTDKPVNIEMSGDDLIHTLFGTLYDSSIIPFMPEILDRAHQSDTRMLADYIEIDEKFSSEADFSVGMYYSVECYEEVPFNSYDVAEAATAEHPELNGLIINEYDFTICPEWGAGDPPALENEAIESDIPTLVMAGDHDPITPPHWGELTADNLENATYVEFPGLGHGASVADDCPESIAFAFVGNPERDPSTSCVASMTAPDYITDIAYSPGVYNLVLALLVDTDFFQFFVIGFFLLSFMGMSTVWPLMRIVHRANSPAESPNPSFAVTAAGWLSAISGVWNGIIFIAVVAMIIAVVGEAEIILLFGYPTWAIPILLLPYTALFLLLVQLVLTIPVWREAFWGLFGRVSYVLILLVEAGYVFWLFYWGLGITPF